MYLVSVIIPFFKKRKFFQKTLSSVISQTYKKIEIIIIYDDTNYSDLIFLKKICKIDKRIRLIVNKKNLGAGISRNKGIESSKGKFITFIDADDLWKKNKISTQLKFMIKNNADISHTDFKIINDQNKILGLRKARDFNNLNDILMSCDVGLSTVMIKKNLLGPKDRFPNLKTKEDFVLWIILLKKKLTFKSINKALTFWRKTNNSLSSSTFQKLLDGFRVYNTFLKFNFIKSFFYLFMLSFNYILKKFN